MSAMSLTFFHSTHPCPCWLNEGERELDPLSCVFLTQVQQQPELDSLVWGGVSLLRAEKLRLFTEASDPQYS
jgi:hypothetical protein